MGKLFIVSTPIGNLQDITLRALQVLKEADIVLTEDTRSTGKLLTHFQIPGKQLISFFEGNEERRIPEVVRLLEEGKTIALVSESGTPLISDPGYKLVQAAIAQNFPIESIPGPTAALAALTVSGLPTNSFIFLGFLPKKKSKIKTIFQHLDKMPEITKTAIFYESPHRLLSTLQLIKESLGNIDIVIARELTKIHEEVRREKVDDSIAHFVRVKPRGEFTILLRL